MYQKYFNTVTFTHEWKSFWKIVTSSLFTNVDMEKVSVTLKIKCQRWTFVDKLQYKFSELLTINCYFRNIIYLFFCFQGFFFVYFCTVCLPFALYSNMNICCFFFIKYTYVCQCFFLEKKPQKLFIS